MTLKFHYILRHERERFVNESVVLKQKLKELDHNLTLFEAKHKNDPAIKWFRKFLWGEISLERLDEISRLGDETAVKEDTGNLWYNFLKNWIK